MESNICVAAGTDSGERDWGSQLLEETVTQNFFKFVEKHKPTDTRSSTNHKED